MEHEFIKSESGQVHYWIHRHGNPDAKCIVFTHGLTADHSMFETQTEFFKNEYTVITWDVPLHGLSRPYGTFSYCQTAFELRKILDTENIEEAVLVGMSMGGYVSQAFIQMYPDMVTGFVALDTTPFGIKYYSKTDIFLLKRIDKIMKYFPDGMLRKSLAKSVSTTDYSFRKMIDMMKPMTKTEIITQIGIAYGRFTEEITDAELTCPVLILLGDSDRTGKVKSYCWAWSAATGFPLRIINNAAHFSNGDNPDQVNTEIQSFIRILRKKGIKQGAAL